MITKGLKWAWKQFIGIVALVIIVVWMALDWVFGGWKK